MKSVQEYIEKQDDIQYPLYKELKKPSHWVQNSKAVDFRLKINN